MPKPTGDNVQNVMSKVKYPTLGEAVAAANSGDHLAILVDSLVVGPVKIDKSLTLASEHGHSVLTPGIDTCGQGSARGWFQVTSGSQLDMHDLTFDGAGRQIYEAFRHQGSGTFYGVDFKNIAYQSSGPAYQGTAIAVFGQGASLAVTFGDYTNIGRTGILFYGSGVSGVVNGLTFTGKGHGHWVDYGVDVEAGAQVTVKNSTITQCLGAADGSGSAAVEASTFQGAGTQLTLTGNSIQNNTTGIAAGYGGGHNPDTTLVVAHKNTITGNHSALDAETDKPINATDNYWGCKLGPGHPGCDPITGPYASQVKTGFAPAATWHFNDSIPKYGPMNGQSSLAVVTFSPAPPDGTQASFSAVSAELSIDRVEVEGGVAATTFTTSTASGVMEISVTIDGVKSQQTLSLTGTQYLIPKLGKITRQGQDKLEVDALNFGGTDTIDVYGSTAMGYTKTQPSGCQVGLEDAKLLGTATASGSVGPDKVEATLPGELQGKTIYIQAVNASIWCEVTQVVKVEP